MKTNFSIHTDFICILFEEQYLDIHNNFDFVDFKHDETNRTAELNFKKSNGDWIEKNEADGFKIGFVNVKSIYQKDHDIDYPIEYIMQDSNTIDVIGFSYDSNEIMDGVVDVNSTKYVPSLIFIFVTGKAIKVTADSAFLLLD